MAQENNSEDREKLTYYEVSDEGMKASMDEFMSSKDLEFNKEEENFLKEANKKNGVMDLSLRNMVMAFLNSASKGMLSQFAYSNNEYTSRFNAIEQAVIYKFKDEMIKLYLEKTKNENEDKAMPRKNMWIETFLDFEGHSICGIHIAKVRILPDNTMIFDINTENKFPHADSAIAVFYTGFDKRGVQYVTNFILDEKMNTKLYSSFDERKKAKYVCPYCANILTEVKPKKYACHSGDCIKEHQTDRIILYNTNKKSIRDRLQTLKLNHVWCIEDKVRLFVSNLLDYYMDKEVEFYDGLTEEQAEKKNEKLRRKGKSIMVAPIKLVKAGNKLKKRILRVERKYGSYEIARKRAHVVQSYWFKFLNKEHYTRLYGWIAGCRTIEEKKERLKKLKRVDEEGFEEYDVYKWDVKHDCIRVLVHEHERCKDEGNEDDRTEIRVIE